VAERLGEVADLAAAAHVVLLGQHAEVVGQSKQPLEELARLLDATVEGESADKPERADQELTLIAREPVVRFGRGVARDEAVATELAQGRIDRARHSLVAARQKTDERDIEIAGVAERGHIESDSAEDAGDRAHKASRDLPMADRLGMLLHDVTDQAPDFDPDEVADQDWVEDYLQITEVEPGKIWFGRGVRPAARGGEAPSPRPQRIGGPCWAGRGAGLSTRRLEISDPMRCWARIEH